MIKRTSIRSIHGVLSARNYLIRLGDEWNPEYVVITITYH